MVKGLRSTVLLLALGFASVVNGGDKPSTAPSVDATPSPQAILEALNTLGSYSELQALSTLSAYSQWVEFQDRVVETAYRLGEYLLPCQDCHGSGLETCPICNGTMRVMKAFPCKARTCKGGQRRCAACDGAGVVNCPFCDGAGYRPVVTLAGTPIGLTVYGEKTVSCQRFVTCRTCNGDTSRWFQCECGEGTIDRKLNCVTCRKGFVRCQTCDGSGNWQRPELPVETRVEPEIEYATSEPIVSTTPTETAEDSEPTITAEESRPIHYSQEAQSDGGGGGKTVQVKGYHRKDGTYVPPHTRSAPRRK